MTLPRVSRRSTLLPVLMVCAGLLGGAGTVAAQAPTPADTAAVLLDAARDFESRGRTEIAEALYQLLADRYPSTAAGSQVVAMLARGRASAPDGSGRVELQVWGTLYGLWLGVAVPIALDSGDAEAFGAGILLGAPAGFLSARALTRSRSLTEGQTRAITWGGTWGTWQGLGWSEVFDLGSDVVCDGDFCYESGNETPARVASMVAGGITGLVVGGLLSRRDIPAGVATGAHYGSLWGSWIGVAGALLADVEDDDKAWTATLLAGNAGLVAGAALVSRYEWSRNRVRLVSLGGLLGGLAGVGIDLLSTPDDDRVVVGIPLATSLGGLVVATAMTRDYDRGPRGGGAEGMALLNYDAGAWSAGFPMPMPALVRVPDARGRDVLRPALRIEWLRGSF